MELASIFFGLFFGLLVPTLMKVVQQTWNIWRRTRSLSNVYLYMIWVETIVNLIFSLTTYLYIHGIIKDSLAYYFGAVTLWAIQTQLLPQIIVNRVALIMVDKRKARLLKWVLFILVGCVNITVFCIWIPAHMPSATPTKILLNKIWEWIEKSFFLLVDLVLNLYFLYLVRSRLIEGGIRKYWLLFKFNAAIIVVSLSMDVLLLGLLNLPDQYVYVQFAPIAYIVKLHIELTMAELISKVARSSAAERVDDWYSSGNHTSKRTRPTGPTAAGQAMPQPDGFFAHSTRMNTNIHERSVQNENQVVGIVKTVTTVVRPESSEDGSQEYLVEANDLTGDLTSYKSYHVNVSASP